MHTGHKNGCGCHIQDFVDKAYNVKGENFLSPKNDTIAKGFWNAGQSKKIGKNHEIEFEFDDDDYKPKKGGKK